MRSDAGPRARARDDRGLPRGSRRPPTEVPARRALCLLQQRLRRARAHRRARDRHSLPRARAEPRLRARGDARHRVPALGRAPARTARGYLEGNDTSRTNVFHLPVRGSGDGGIYSTAADIRSLWTAFFDGRIVSDDWVAEMVRPRSDVSSKSRRYGLGFWLHASADAVLLTGSDAGVSFSSLHEPQSNVTRTVISNTAHGTWPISSFLDDRLLF